MSTIIPVILAGGKGKKLWPISSKNRPKQFLKLDNSNSTLFQKTYKRALGIAEPKNIITVASIDDLITVKRQLSQVQYLADSNILFEESSHNTAFSIISAAKLAMSKYEYPILWIMPCDHIIEDPKNLYDAIENSIGSASYGQIVTFGIKPNRADPNYGYIQAGSKDLNSFGLKKVERFIEKPPADLLISLLANNDLSVNSGMFLMSSETIFNEFKQHCPSIMQASLDAFENMPTTSGKIQLLKTRNTDKINFQSIDKAIMEKSDKLSVKKVDIDWTDIGSWYSLWQVSQKTGQGQTSLEKFLNILEKAS